MKWITNIQSAWTAYRRYVRVKTDVEEAMAEWERIGKFEASTRDLINFMYKFSVNLVEYAKWTPTEYDDIAAILIRNVLSDHRDIIVRMIDWVRGGHEPTLQEFTVMAEGIYAVANNEIGSKIGNGSSNELYGSPMNVLFVITTLYRVLKWLKEQRDTPPGPIPNPFPTPPPVRRPIRNLVQKIFNRI